MGGGVDFEQLLDCIHNLTSRADELINLIAEDRSRKEMYQEEVDALVEVIEEGRRLMVDAGYEPR